MAKKIPRNFPVVVTGNDREDFVVARRRAAITILEEKGDLN